MNRQTAYQIAAELLESYRVLQRDELMQKLGSVSDDTVTGPDGKSYFVEVSVARSEKGNSARITATVDLGSSFKLERIEESITVPLTQG